LFATSISVRRHTLISSLRGSTQTRLHPTCVGAGASLPHLTPTMSPWPVAGP
jgi:hypothetical protein